MFLLDFFAKCPLLLKDTPSKTAANVMKNTAADLKMAILSQIWLFLECMLSVLNYRTFKKNENEFLL
jgi:hypothetical protein